jgi:hypothetical protein
MLKFIFLLFFSFSLAVCSGQNLFFEKIFGTQGSDFARSVKQLDDGSIFITGYSDSGSYGGFDISLTKLDRFGNTTWTKFYGNIYSDYGLYLNKTADGNLVITGETYNIYGESDPIVIALDTSGTIIWQKTFVDTLYQSLKYIEQTRDKGFILSGFKSDGFGTQDIYVLKLDSLGNKQWDKSIGGTDLDYSDMIHQTDDLGYILTSDTRSKGAGGIDIEITKLDSAGNIIWDETFGDAFQNGCQGILITSDKKYLSYGETNVKVNFSPFDFYLEKIDTNGVSIWKKVFGGTGSDAIFSAVETTDKGFMLTGYGSLNGQPSDLVIIKTDSLGEPEWQLFYGDSGIDIGYDIITSLDHGFLITGKTYADDDQYYLLHLNEEGLTGLAERNILHGITLFPNPCQTYFDIISSSEVLAVNIYSVAGQLISSGSFKENKMLLPPGLKTGLYFVQVSTLEGNYFKTLIISP